MPRPFPIGLTPPDWLVRNLRPQPAPVNRPAVAAVALTLPLVLGLAAGRPTYGALAAMGALSGVISDTADAYRMRLLNIAIPQLFSAVGITLGSLVWVGAWLADAVADTAAYVERAFGDGAEDPAGGPGRAAASTGTCPPSVRSSSGP